MTRDAGRTSWIASLAALLCAALLTGCAGRWMAQPAPGRTLAGGSPQDLRVTFAGGDSTAVLRRAVLAGDSLVGTDPAGARRAVALAAARRVERWEGPAQRTAAAVILAGVAALVSLIVLVAVSLPHT